LTTTPSSNFKKAQDFASKKDWDKAIVEYEKLLDRETSQNASLYNLIGDLNSKKGDLDRAFQNYEKAIDIYCEQTLYNNAIALCKKCLRLDDARVEIYNKLGGLFASQGLVQDALHYLTEYAKRKRMTGESKAVEATWKRILSIAPDNTTYRGRYIEALIEMKHHREAASELDSLALLHRQRGEEKDAAAAERRAQEMAERARSGPGAEPAGAEAGSRASATRAAAAPKGVAVEEEPVEHIAIDWSAKEKQTPDSPGMDSDLHIERTSDVLYTSADVPAPAIDLGIDLGLDGDDTGGDAADASSAIEHGLDHGNVSVRERAEQEDDLIDLNEVLDEFRSGVSQVIAKEDYQSHYDLGLSYKEMELFEDAIEAFRAALPSDAHHFPSLEMIGECLLEKGDAVKAIAHLTEALAGREELNVQDVGLRYVLGNAYLRQKDRTRAAECYKSVLAADPNFRDAATRLAHVTEQSD
jgi:tetratricopeptide (TPR) repeat protein